MDVGEILDGTWPNHEDSDAVDTGDMVVISPLNEVDKINEDNLIDTIADVADDSTDRIGDVDKSFRVTVDFVTIASFCDDSEENDA